MSTVPPSDEQLREAVRTRYARTALQVLFCLDLDDHGLCTHRTRACPFDRVVNSWNYRFARDRAQNRNAGNSRWRLL